MSAIRPDELDERLEGTDRPFLLDVRPRTDYQHRAIERSHNVPVYHELSRGDDSGLRDRLDEIPDDRAVVVVCKMGVVAKRATALLTEEGYDATTLAGGMRGWVGYRNGSIGHKVRSLVWKLR